MTLITKINKKEISIEEANKELLELELKYDIVSKETVEEIKDKLKIDNIEEIISEY